LHQLIYYLLRKHQKSVKYPNGAKLLLKLKKMLKTNALTLYLCKARVLSPEWLNKPIEECTASLLCNVTFEQSGGGSDRVSSFCTWESHAMPD
jgi:hypothetical protein